MRSRSNLCTIQSSWNTEGGEKWSETSVTIVFLCLCRADVGETEVAFSDEWHGAGFPFSLLVPRITAGLIETCSGTFITSVRFYYLFSSLAERSLSTCHMEGWMNNKGRATNNSSCLLRSLRVTRWPVCMFGRPPGPATFSLQILPVYLPGSADLLEQQQHAYSHLRWQVPPEFGLEVSVSDLVLLTQQRNRFPPHTWTPRVPFYCCSHRMVSSGAAALPALQLHTWTAASVHQCQTHSILPLGPAPTPRGTSPLHS